MAENTRDIPIILKSGQRATAEVDNGITDQQFAAQIQAEGHSLDRMALWKQGLVSKLPRGTQWAGEAFIPGSIEQLMGDVVGTVAGIKGAQVALKGTSLAARAGGRLLGPAAGAATTLGAGAVTGDVDQWKNALGMLVFGGLAEGGMAAGRFVTKNITQAARYKQSKEMATQLGQAVHRWFPNAGTEEEMIQLFRMGGAEKVAGEKLGAMQAEIFEKVGARKQIYLSSLPLVNDLVGIPVPLATYQGKSYPVAHFDDVWTALQELRALRRSALSQTEPMKHAKVLRVTQMLEDELRGAFRDVAPDALGTFEAHKKVGRAMYSVIHAAKETDIVQTAPRAGGGVVELQPFWERFVQATKPGTKDSVMQDLIESGAGDFIHGVLPAGAKPGASDVIHAGRGIYARTRFGEGTATGALLPFPETRRFAVPPAGSTVTRPAAAAGAAQAGGETFRRVLTPELPIGP